MAKNHLLPNGLRPIHALLCILFWQLTPQVYAAQDHGSTENEGITGPTFVTFDTLLFSVVSDGRIKGLMSVTVRLQLENEDDRNFVENLRPKLRDRYISSLGRLGTSAIDIRKPLDFDRLTLLLQHDTDIVLGRHMVRLLITDITSKAS